MRFLNNFDRDVVKPIHIIFNVRVGTAIFKFSVSWITSQKCDTYPIAAERRHVIIIAGITKLDSVLAGFGLTAQGTFPAQRERD